MYMKVKDVAEFLNISPSMVHKGIKAGKFHPVNPDTYHSDGGYLFLKEEIEKMKPEYQDRVKAGFSVMDVARAAGVSPATVRADIKGGLLEARQMPGGRKEYRVSEEELHRYKQIKKAQERLPAFRFGRYHLYQKIHKGHLVARIVDIDRGLVTVQHQNGAIERLTKTDLAEWNVFMPLQKKSTVSYPGEVAFRFPKPDYIDHPLYQLMDLLIQYAGINNVCIIGRNSIDFKVKRISLPKSVFSNWLDAMKTHLVDGEIVEGYQDYILQPDCFPVTTYVSRQLKQKIQEEAEKEGKSMQEWLRDLVYEYFPEDSE